MYGSTEPQVGAPFPGVVQSPAGRWEVWPPLERCARNPGMCTGVSALSRALASFLALLMTGIWPVVAGADANGTLQADSDRCKVRGVVVVIVGQASQDVSEFGHMVSRALSRYPCYSIRDVTDSLEAGMGAGLERLDDAHAQADEGLEAFLAMDLTSAREHFVQSVEAYTDGFAYLAYHGRFADALMYLGAAEAGLGNRDEAVQAFRAAIRLRSDVDPADYSAMIEARKAFDVAAVLAGTNVVGGLLVDSEPAGAEVFLDGVFAGVTPLDDPEVPAGPHWVVLKKAGFVRKAIPLEVPSGSSTAISAEQGQLTPARRKPLFDTAMRKLAMSGPMEDMAAIEDLKALFLSDMAVVVRIRKEHSGVAARLSFWDLTTMQRLWSGTDPESGLVTYLGRGAAESLVSRAISVDEARASVQEGGAATLMAKKGVWWKQWWFWTVIGTVVVGGTVAAVLLTRPDGSNAGIAKDGTGAVIVRF